MNKKAFTIVELLLVVLIISIVTIIALPSIFSAVNESKVKSYKEYEKLIKNSLEMYNIDLKEDLWLESVKFVEVNKDSLQKRNQDLDLNNKDCTIDGNMYIYKGNKANSYTYEVCLYCGHNDNGKYTLNGLKYDWRSDDCK